VVNLSSGGHVGSDIVWDDPNYDERPYDKFESYGQSKTANILFTVELDRRLSARGVRSYAVHPGMIATELGRYMTRDDMKALRDRAKAGPSGPRATSRSRRVRPQAWAATAPSR
jgi:NAD(P)-dependent dehydrogenase (short-subunit alcohol dehydrogenase family)